MSTQHDRCQCRRGDGDKQIIVFSAALVLRWRLPSGTEIDSGFRGDDRGDYARWVSHEIAAGHENQTGAA